MSYINISYKPCHCLWW